MAEPQDPDAHDPPAEVAYSVSIRWRGEHEFDPPIDVKVPENCELGVFKERLANDMSDEHEERFPDQLVVIVNGHRLEGDEEVIPAGSVIQVEEEEENYQEKINEFINKIRCPQQQAEWRTVAVSFSDLPHNRTGTMAKSRMMKHFLDLLEESYRDAGQLRGKSAMVEFLQKLIQRPDATMESVLVELEE